MTPAPPKARSHSKAVSGENPFCFPMPLPLAVLSLPEVRFKTGEKRFLKPVSHRKAFPHVLQKVNAGVLVL